MKFPFKMIDLTHPIAPNSPSWDGHCGFEHKIIWDYDACDTDVKFRVQTIQMAAGMGTHIDAPAHCVAGGKTIEDLSLDSLLSPCVMIDVSKHMHENYQLTAEDIKVFEREFGPIEKQSFIIIYTGWSQFWDKPVCYRNQLQFPSISFDAVTLLLKRNIAGLGIDTLSPDIPQSGYPVHQAILGEGKYIIENIANAIQLPPIGSFSLALPILTVGGTEAPIRLVAFVKKE